MREETVFAMDYIDAEFAAERHDAQSTPREVCQQHDLRKPRQRIEATPKLRFGVDLFTVEVCSAFAARLQESQISLCQQTRKAGRLACKQIPRLA